MLLRMLTLTVVVSTVNHLPAQTSYPPEFPGTKTVTYKSVDAVDLKMWLFQPEDHDPDKDSRPAIVFFFGGGWKSGTPAQFERHCRYLASRGMMAATADYRVASRHSVKAVDCVEDAKSAVRWLRANAKELGIDPARICAAGGSAGGHTACCTALISKFDAVNENQNVSSVPDAMALFNPATMIAALDGFDSGMTPEKFADIATRTGVDPKQISPIHHVRADLPPTIIFHGRVDTTVPYATAAEFSRRMQAAGNRCELQGFAEAPHGFFNHREGKPGERQDRSDQWYRRTLLQLDGFLKSLGWLEGESTIRVVDHDFVSLRGHVQNSFLRFASEKQGHVAFIGGSITEMDGYRPRIAAWLQKRFPETKFTFTAAGIASTCSNTGAFRLNRDVLSQGSVDLLFVEFAVNDDQDAGHAASACIQGMEGVIRQTLAHNPNADIVMTHFVNPGMLETLSAGENILSATAHEAVARHYDVSSVYLSRAVAAQVNDQTLTWKQFGGTHPGPIGNQLAADLATAILDSGWKGLTATNAAIEPHPLPQPLQETSFDRGHLLPLNKAEIVSGWTLSEPEWDKLPGGKRARFTGFPLLHATKPGGQLRLTFSGTAVGVFVVAGPDAGQLQFRIDDGEWGTVELYHRFSKGLHYPRTVMFASELEDGEHQLEVRVAKTKHAASTGHAARILNFAVNGILNN